MTDPNAVPLLLTPGPLTTSETTKRAMLRDWGSRDGRFVEMNVRIRRRLVDLVNGGDRFVAVPIQGSGTFAVEAMLGTMLPPDGKILLAINGAYGHRMARIVEMLGRAAVEYETAEDTPIDAAEVGRRLDADPAITHVAIVHCETTSGVLNPVEAVAVEVARRGRRLLIDAMAAFGALPLDVSEVACDAVAASSNKCLEGVPGLGFMLARREAIEACEGNAHALSLDLYDQWRFMERAGQWRFTPPTHVIAAFDQALTEHAAEGGVAGRGARYRENCRILVDGMRAMGFETLLPDAIQAPIIVTFHMPSDPAFQFQSFYDRLRDRGFVIYPGKLTVADSFRIGCIGQLHAADMHNALAAIAATLAEMGVTHCSPVPVARRATA
ncbi:2-aminoethylphosphonate--pyruvate transaminase [Stella humosa]|uniref:2-aminoethylphosphonate--pyruvate transaminase n=1 Tax=Stella humosa TaxID=94 RepID=A0A3N1M8W7_9PROT|nr:2-aminoethylphosphonate--pyruvate transaminase [Stella humosa]ROQ00153.1 2-aminoethylphosphonate--pyruvate transaminase [Stella humosa]BBK30613.1 2-aminoethylphosphonate--pyruvate transaminase [Stella humosa]